MYIYLYILLYITFGICVLPVATGLENRVATILKRMEKYDNSIFKVPYEDAVLILGYESNDKRIFAEFIAGNNEQLRAKTEHGIDKASSETDAFPRLTVDGETNVAYYNCPEFDDDDDVIDEVSEISSAYFMKSVMNNVKRVKLIFVVTQATISSEGLNELLKHCTQLVTNIDKYRNSMLLVVTEAANHNSEEEDNVVTALSKMKEKLTAANRKRFKPFYVNAIKLLDAFLQKDGAHYPKIYISKKPLLKNERKSMETKIYETIRFTTKDDNDFVINLSEEARVYLPPLQKAIEKRILANIVNIETAIKEHYHIEEIRRYDLDATANLFQQGFVAFSHIKGIIEEYVNPQQFVKEIVVSAKNFGIDLSSEIMLNILRQDKQLHFIWTFRQRVGQALVNGLSLFENLVQYLSDSNDWYNFLVYLYDTLSTYKVQKDVSKYNFTSLQFPRILEEDSWIQLEDFSDFKYFLIEIQGDKSFARYENVKAIKVKELKLKALHDVLDTAVTYPKVALSCIKGNKLLIKGNYLILSALNKNIPHVCPEKLQAIEMFAFHKIFIDENFMGAVEQLQLSIISPLWEIVGNQTVILDGKPGKPRRIPKAEHGTFPSGDGKDGKPGLRGENAGNFLGIGIKFINDSHLNISLNGGRGGPGQNGGNGADGNSGLDPLDPRQYDVPLPELWETVGFPYISNTKHVYNWQQILHSIERTYVINGKVAGKGGNGGNGGIGGRRGDAGTAVIIALDSRTDSVVTAEEGTEGLGGFGGEGGHGGRNGKDMKVKVISNVISPHYSSVSVQSYYPPGTSALADSGKKGSPGIGLPADNDSSTRNLTRFLDISNVINDYKYHLMEYLSGTSIVKRLYLTHFLTRLYNDTRIRNVYNTLGLVGGLQVLEHQFYKLSEDREFPILTLYDSLLRGIGEYAQNPKEHEKSAEYKKVLGYLYTATLSKICAIHAKSDNHLVLDIQEYTSQVLQRILQLKEGINQKSLETENLSYQKLINAGIAESAILINKQILPTLLEMINEADASIKTLIDELVEAQKQTTKETRTITKLKHSLKKTLQTKITLHSLKLYAMFLSFAGANGAAALLALSENAVVDKSLAWKYQTVKVVGNLPRHFSTSAEKLASEIEQQDSLLDLQLDDILQLLEELKREHPAVTGCDETIRRIEEVKAKLAKRTEAYHACDLDELSGYETDKQDIDALLRLITSDGPYVEDHLTAYRAIPMKLQPLKLMDANDVLENVNKQTDVANEVGNVSKEMENNEEEQLSNQEAKTSQRIGSGKTYRQYVVHIQNIFKCTDFGNDIYSSFGNDWAKIRLAANIAEKLHDQVLPLRQQRNDTYDVMGSLCKVITSYAKEHKLMRAVEMQRGNIQYLLKALKLQIQRIFREFSAEESVIPLVENLGSTISILINTFNRIENYRDYTKLVALIDDISSSEANKIDIKTPKLKTALARLTTVLRKNLVLQQYETGVSAFKQYDFPFAKYLVEEFSLANKFKLHTGYKNILNLTTDASEAIQYLLTLLQREYPISKYDRHVYLNEFSKATQPFVVWKNNSYNNIIASLLQGDEILLNADITNSISLDAVKFNTIRIRFKSLIGSLQSELDNRMRHFEVMMTHIGSSSHYRCGNKFYHVASENLTFRYYPAEGTNQKPFDNNLLYGKIKNGYVRLSPYALWSIKLTETNNQHNSLKKFINNVDLILEGTGQYLEPGKFDLEMCHNNLDAFYTVDSSMLPASSLNNTNLENLNVNLNASKPNLPLDPLEEMKKAILAQFSKR